MQTNVDVLIIGAGPAGSTAAALLHKEGFRLLVVEKQHFPRFVIGESLLPHSMDLLKEAGLLPNVEEQKFMQKGGAVFLREASMTIAARAKFIAAEIKVVICKPSAGSKQKPAKAAPITAPHVLAAYNEPTRLLT